MPWLSDPHRLYVRKVCTPCGHAFRAMLGEILDLANLWRPQRTVPDITSERFELALVIKQTLVEECGWPSGGGHFQLSALVLEFLWSSGARADLSALFAAEQAKTVRESLDDPAFAALEAAEADAAAQVAIAVAANDAQVAVAVAANDAQVAVAVAMEVDE